MNDIKNSLTKSKEISLNWVYPGDLKSYFVSNTIVQHQKDHFILSFFEVWPPAFLGTEEQIASQLNNLDKVDAKCVSRIVLTPEKMLELIKVLDGNYSKYLSTLGEKAK